MQWIWCIHVIERLQTVTVEGRCSLAVFIRKALTRRGSKEINNSPLIIQNSLTVFVIVFVQPWLFIQIYSLLLVLRTEGYTAPWDKK